MAIIGYECSDHGFRHDCTVGDSGETYELRVECPFDSDSCTVVLLGDSGKLYEKRAVQEEVETSESEVIRVVEELLGERFEKY